MNISYILKKTFYLSIALAVIACGSSASNKESVEHFVDVDGVEVEKSSDKAVAQTLPYTDDVREHVVLDYGNRTIRTDGDETICFADRMKNKQNCFIVMSKKDYYLYVYEAQGKDTVLLARYDCCFALKKGNKQKPGDMRTPHCTMKNPFIISQIAAASGWKHDFGDGRGNIKSYGDFFLRLVTPGHKGIGIHGSTNNSESVPGRASEGCIRLKDDDIRSLRNNFAFVGMKVIIKAEEVDDLPFEIKAIKAWEDDNIVRKRHFDPKKTLTNEQIQQAQPEKGRVKGAKQRAEAEKVRENANDVAAVPASKSKNMTLDQLNSSR